MPENEDFDYKVITEKLDELTKNIQEIVQQGLKNNSFTPNKRQYIKWKTEGFEYSDKGVKTGQSTGSHILKDDWSSVVFRILIEIEKTGIGKELDDLFKEKSNGIYSQVLHSFIQEVALEKLQQDPNENKIQELKNNFLKIIKKEARERKLKAELMGITLHSKIWNISESISLRQPIKEDFEIEQTEEEYHRRGFLIHPSAFLEITMMTKNEQVLEQIKRKLLEIFKLFKVGSVAFLRSTTFMGIPTLVDGNGYATSHYTSALEIAVITQKDEESFQTFYHVLENKIPENFGISNHNLSFSEIAFSRYNEALMKSNSLESRISETMMGLESIYLQENAELSYRLRLRISKIMGYFGFDPHDTSRILVDAYEIRSQYVHGGLLDFKPRKKLEVKYGNIQNLLTKLLDFLRISIVMTMLMHVGKDEFVSRIDESFIDTKAEGGVSQIVNPAKNALGIK